MPSGALALHGGGQIVFRFVVDRAMQPEGLPEKPAFLRAAGNPDHTARVDQPNLGRDLSDAAGRR